MNTPETIDLIDLGLASVETKGGGEKLPDMIDHQDPAGISDD